jgi:hypothetical protein
LKNKKSGQSGPFGQAIFGHLFLSIFEKPKNFSIFENIHFNIIN